ncbi:MAG: NUDIX domain-containing protein [Chloroflexi bacterium]|nr:NUDIX domain-containing protein [Chloroflexota bacterium]
MKRRVQVHSTVREYDGFFKIDRAEVSYERFDGRMSPPVTRYVFERGDSVGVLLYHPGRDSVILTEQFRYPAHVHGGPGWLIEIVAGMIEEGSDPLSTAKRELLEEAGYEVQRLEHAATFYLSPGGSSERLHLYIGEVSDGAKIAAGGGIGGDEDLRVLEVPLSQALDMVRDGRIADAKTIIALQWLALSLGAAGQR